MKNLKLQYCKHYQLSLENLKSLLLNPNARKKDEKIFVVTDNNLYSWDCNGCSGDLLVDLPARIVSAEYLALDNEICLATEVGEVLVVNLQTLEQHEGTFCDVGIENMAWSPDQEVVVFVTKTRNVVVMTSTYEVLAELSLADDTDSSELFVNVGWGRKETQFHGSEGKRAAKQSSTFEPPENIQDLPQNVEISWRADGAYFAVSFVSEQIGRMFKVFDKEGKLHYISEKLNGLEYCIAWRPSGNWIAIPHRLPNKSTIGLFEKNGLRHREIVLPFDLKDETILSLKWSCDSDILAIHTQSISNEKQKIYLYTISNYHWYLKQTISFEDENKVANMIWDTRMGEEKSLHIILENGKYYNYSWRFGIDKYQDEGAVGVIDGNKLLFSNFDKSVVPPPMCNEELIIENNINSCIFITKYEICLFDDEQKLHFFQRDVEAEPFQRNQTLEAVNKVPLHHLVVVSSDDNPNNELLLASQTTEKNTSNLLLIPLRNTENISNAERSSYRIEDIYSMKNLICALTNGYSLFAEAFLQTLDGQTHLVTIKKNQKIVVDSSQTFSLNQTISELQWYGTRCYEKTGLVSLTTKQCLYIDDQRIAEDVTSCCCTGNYLAFTKLSTLQFYHLVENRLVSERKVERGSKLITIIGNDGRTVLQMPRGNLEAIYPRYLSLEIIRNLLNHNKYATAMETLRKQRINLNIICDHNMVQFVNNINQFLNQIKNPNLLNLFLTDLQNEDFTQTMYASNYKGSIPQYPPNFKIEQKVKFLCEALCEEMESISVDLYRLPIITTYVKCGNIEKALLQIWKQKQQECVADAGAGVNQQAEAALKYLLYLIDVNDLYNVALGTYNFSLVLFVAQKSQKDPKEFLQFLNELKLLETNYRHFKIEEHLKRYDRALSHIANCSDEKFQEALAFIKKHSLYQKALTFYKDNEDSYKAICLAFGDYLRSNNNLENASLMYERGGDINQAILSAKHVLDWERVLTLAKRNNMDLAEISLSMIPSLEENGKYLEAFYLCKNYCQDLTSSFNSLFKGKLFLKAIFEARILETGNEQVILDELQSYAASLENSLQSEHDLFLEFKKRLVTIRERKDQGFDDYNQQEIDECDLLSDTTSVRSSQFTSSSRGTGKTFRSAKNRRKHERKLLSLKPGNPFEDIALIDAIYNLINKIYNQQKNIHYICKALIEFREDSVALSLQNKFRNLLNLIKDSLDSIWIDEMCSTVQQHLTGPNIDYTQLKKEQRYALIDPVKRFKPQLTLIKWEHEILK